MKIAFVFIFMVGILSCQHRADENSGTYSDTTYLDIKGKQYKFLGQIPDSLRTAEQKTLIDKINEVTVRYIAVKNNRMVLEIGRDEFIARGIPERYYHMLAENIRDNNAFFDSNGIKNVDSLVKERKEEYFRSMPRQSTPE